MIAQHVIVKQAVDVCKFRFCYLTKIKIYAFVVLAFFLNPILNAQKNQKKNPRLVIGLIIDNLRTDMLYRYWYSFENNGFRRLINEGTRFDYVNLNFFYTQTAPTMASLVCGCYPSSHGIIANEWYDDLSGKIQTATGDESVICVGSETSSEKHSPKKMITSTIGDELRLATFKQSKTFALSLDAMPATLLAGQTANGAYWFDIFSGKMVTSSAFQNELPQWIKDFNAKKLPDIYLQQTWNLLYPDSTYSRINFPDNSRYENGIKGKKTFPYDLKSMSVRTDGGKDYSLLKYTPMGNNLLKDFALTLIVNEELGKDDYPDLLLINFNTTEYIAQQFGILSYEFQDALLRLDKELAHLLGFIDSYVGKQNVLLFLTSPHGAAYPNKMMNDLGFRAGQFNAGQAYVLLKSYLKAIYGDGDWVKFWKGQQIYLNHQLIQQARVDKEKMQREVARFLLDFDGIGYVIISEQVSKNGTKQGVYGQLNNSFYLGRSGDVMYALLPNWTEMGESLAPHNTGYSYDSHVPLIFYGWYSQRQTVVRPIDMQDLAATIAAILKIPFPNACQGTPIPEMINNE
ncbi:MAG: alkaline phosphatase family protein [Bacteroidales bacterium]|nr:alkaline phosphatase family protein [Bacteroidales bacterium]